MEGHSKEVPRRIKLAKIDIKDWITMVFFDSSDDTISSTIYAVWNMGVEEYEA